MYHLAEKKSKLKIKSLKLKNFRNYELLNLEFDGSTNIFYGDNAQGKTNILEAVYLSGTTKSHRGSKDRDMIQFGAEESHIEVIVEKRGIQDQIDMHLKKNRPKGVAINKIPIRKAGELFGIVNLVFFSPEDLNIIKNGPAGRRKFIDLELSQLDKVYFNHLSNYSRIVNQRNHLLKDSAYRQDAMETLDIWDLQLVQYGNAIIARRKQFVDEMNEIVSGIHKKLTANLKERPTIEELSKEYLINTSTLKETFKGIYGMPIATYMKTYRIKQAAVLLRQTQDTVADIAQQVGYINQSKFATAFREIMKISPTEYRSQYEANPKTILHD